MKASWEAVPGLSSQDAVRVCTALPGGSGYFGIVARASKESMTSSPCYRSGAETLLRLAKGEKRSRIQQPSTTACIFLPVQVIQS